MADEGLVRNGVGREAVSRIADALERSHPPFARKEFERAATKGLAKLKLKERVDHIIQVLHRFLPSDFVEAERVLSRVRHHWNWGDPDDSLSGFAAWPVIDYVGTYGLSHPQEALEVLRQLTSLHSAELAIRPYIQDHFAITLQVLESWCSDPDEHVRRLVSEGMRPRLPWAKRLPRLVENPEVVLRFVELLKDDRSEYVRRSIANNLNDISKDHPDLVVEVCRKWLKSGSPSRDRIVKHATRTLVKRGHRGALEMLGFSVPPQVDVTDFHLTPKKVRIGECITFSFTLRSRSSERQRLVVDYVVHYVKSNGKTSPRVFKMKVVELQPGGSFNIEKMQSFRPICTRKHYSGRHVIEIKVNGVTFGKRTFLLSR